jgi:hypothetical protein
MIGLGQIMLKRGRESASFLKKRSKKLFFSWAVLVSTPQSHRSKKPLFFKKAAAYPFRPKPVTV